MSIQWPTGRKLSTVLDCLSSERVTSIPTGYTYVLCHQAYRVRIHLKATINRHLVVYI